MVLFRESLEVVIVLAIILQFLQKMKQDGLLEESLFYKFRREVWIGASLGWVPSLFQVCWELGMHLQKKLTYSTGNLQTC